MGRPAKYSDDDMLDAAGALVVEGGARALTTSAVARALTAPSGSVYHRFRSRDHLGASLWMRTVERFDAEVVVGTGAAGPPVEVAVAVARHVVEWSATNPTDAFVLTRFRREDLVDGAVPEELASRARALGERQRTAIAGLAERLGRPSHLVSFAVAGIPHAAVRRHVGGGRPIPVWVADAVEGAVRGALAGP